ncbi:MAG: hypothetical protein HYS69_17030 [candidate division NC10 bacterium]|nr:hypothetical protein [candidate division NC10 bacterium]
MRPLEALGLGAASFGIGQAETVHRFCRTCISFHETRARFLPGEAPPDLVPPVCYFQGQARSPGWCGGTAYQEDIP